MMICAVPMPQRYNKFYNSQILDKILRYILKKRACLKVWHALFLRYHKDNVSSTKLFVDNHCVSNSLPSKLEGCSPPLPERRWPKAGGEGAGGGVCQGAWRCHTLLRRNVGSSGNAF